MHNKALTSVNPKNIAVPKTAQEKYDKLKQKNPKLDFLRDTFDLEVVL